jgi:hypothetical protein
MKNCKFPICNHKAIKTWALVDLCQEHYSELKTETLQYYTISGGSHRLAYTDRICFTAIAHLIPWRRKVKV